MIYDTDNFFLVIALMQDLTQKMMHIFCKNGLKVKMPIKLIGKD